MPSLISQITFVNTYNGGLGYWGGYHPQISYDGTFVTFDAVAGVASYVGYTGAQLPPFINVSGTLQSSGAEHVYLKNMATGALTPLDPVVIGSFGLDYAPGANTTSISADGRYVAYQIPGVYDAGQPLTGANVDQVNIVDASTGAIINPNFSANGTFGNGFSGEGALSATGRYVAFRSDSTNLVANDTNGVTDVFLKDTVTGAINLVSVTSNGTQGNSASGFQHTPSVSSDGRYVLFQTGATNLGSLPSSTDVLIKDMQTGALMDLGLANSGAKISSMTPDGRFVVFEIDPFDSYGQIYRFDTVAQTTVLVSTGANGAGDGDSTDASISADGRYVVFESGASNLVANDTTGAGVYSPDIFVKDLTTGSVARLNLSAAGAEQIGGYSFDPQISGDGHYVVFQSGATNLIAGDTNGNPDLFMVINPFWSQPVIGGTAGPDNLVGTAGADFMSGGDGTDTLFGSGGADSLDGGLGNDSIWGGDDNDQLQGNAGDDILQGNAGDDFVRGATGNDQVRGGQGNDTVQGGQGFDTVRGALGNDEMRGGLDNDQLFGGQNNDTLFGGQGNDLLQGLLGDDVLQGLLGNDTLTGGGGLDQFWFHNAGAANADLITDFTPVDDTLVLQAVFFTMLAPGALAAGSFVSGAGATAADGNDYILYNTTSGNLSYDADGNGGGASVLIATLTGAPALAVGDFLIV